MNTDGGEGMNRQLWVRMNHPVADGPIEVPDNPGVVEDFESRGWVRDGTPPFEKKPKAALKLNSERGQRELAKFEAGRFPSVELQFALRESMEVTLEIICAGTDPHRPPHPDELLVTACRDLRKGGLNLYLKGRDGNGGWNTRDGDDGFRYHGEYPKVLATCLGACRMNALRPRD